MRNTEPGFAGCQVSRFVRCHIWWLVSLAATAAWPGEAEAGASASVTAGTYHVAPQGSDQSGGSESQPWKTLLHAVNQLRPGDTLVVAPGHYKGFSVRRHNSGEAGARVRIVARDGAIIDAMIGNSKDGINIEYASHIDIEGFTIINAPRAGIRAVECRDVRIRGNRIHQNAMSGIHTSGDAGMGRDGLTSGALIENNLIYDNGRSGGAAINNDGLRDSIIRNNVIFRNHTNGITLYRIDGKRPSTNNKVVNNTIVMPAGDLRARWCLRVANASTGNLFKNNICINGHPNRGAIDISTDSLSGFASDHNIISARFTLDDGDRVMHLAEWQSVTGQDKNSRVLAYDDIDALFVDAEHGDFRLRGDAPAMLSAYGESEPEPPRNEPARNGGGGCAIARSRPGAVAGMLALSLLALAGVRRARHD